MLRKFAFSKLALLVGLALTVSTTAGATVTLSLMQVGGTYDGVKANAGDTLVLSLQYSIGELGVILIDPSITWGDEDAIHALPDLAERKVAAIRGFMISDTLRENYPEVLQVPVGEEEHCTYCACPFVLAAAGASAMPGPLNTDFRPEERPEYLLAESAAKMIVHCITAPDDVVVHDLTYRPMVESNF